MSALGSSSDGALEPSAGLRRTFALALPASGRLALSTLLGAGALVAAIGLIGTSAWLISRASERPEESSLALAIVAVQFFGLSRGLCRYGERLVGHDGALRLLAEQRGQIYDQLEPLAPAGLPAFRDADLLARLVHDVDSLQDLPLRVVSPFVAAALVGTAAVATMWWIYPPAGLLLGVCLLTAATAVPWITASLARRSESGQAEARAALTVTVADLLEGAPELIVNGAMPAQLSRAAAADAELRRVSSASARTSGLGLCLTTLLAGGATWGALVVGIPAVRGGRLDAVLLAVIALVPLAAFELVATLPPATQALERVRRAANRIFAVADAPLPVTEPAMPLPLSGDRNELRAVGLRVRYSLGGRWVVDGVDLALSPGRRVAIVGPSGSGKSSIAAALLRFVAYQEGSVTLGRSEISELEGDDVRRVVGLLAQDAHIFNTTMVENLRIARRDAHDDDIRRALHVAHLSALVDELPGGVHTPLGEHGAQISGGERQRVALARAVLAGFPVLILDEPAEHLDLVTADALLADLLGLRAEWSTLLVTHRTVGLEAVEEILVLDSGRVHERGTYGELIAADGMFAEMCRREKRFERYELAPAGMPAVRADLRSPRSGSAATLGVLVGLAADASRRARVEPAAEAARPLAATIRRDGVADAAPDRRTLT